MEKMGIIFRKVRELQLITQKDVIDRIQPTELTQAALSAYEANRSSISRVKLRRIAQVINMNPDFVDDNTTNLFSNREGLILLYEKGGGLLRSSLESLFLIIKFHKRVQLIALVAPPDVIRKPYKAARIKWIFAVAARDEAGNVFVIRGRKDLINLIVELPSFKRTLAASREPNSIVSMAEREADERLFALIRDCEVSRGDIKRIFRKESFDEVGSPGTGYGNIHLTDDEKKEVLFQRNIEMRTPTELDLVLIKVMNEKKVTPNVMLSILNAIGEGQLTEDDVVRLLRSK